MGAEGDVNIEGGPVTPSPRFRDTAFSAKNVEETPRAPKLVKLARSSHGKSGLHRPRITSSSITADDWQWRRMLSDKPS